MTPKEFYTTHLTDAEKQISDLQKKISTNSALRLVSFLSALILFFVLIKFNTAFSIIISLSLLSFFIVLVQKSLKLNFEKKRFEHIKLISISELKAIQYDFNSFETGNDYHDGKHPFAADLDVFGQGSLFQMLNRTVLKTGEIQLASWLKKPLLDKEPLLLRQQAIAELSQSPYFMLQFRTTGMLSDTNVEDVEELKKWAKSSYGFIFKPIINTIRIACPILLISSVVAGVFNSVYFDLALYVFLFNFFLIGFRLKKYNEYHSKVSKHAGTLKKYYNLLSLIEKQEFKSELLMQIKDNMHKSGDESVLALKKLERLISQFDNRTNFLAAIFLEGVLLWDLQFIYHIEKWKKNHAGDIGQWFHSIADFDCLVSLGNYAYNYQTTVNFPEFSEKVIITAKNIGHPSISAVNNVTNNFEIKNKGHFSIITGANMAGKSTFLRTIGVNMLLAMIGAPVRAEEVSLTPMQLFTSMRTSDSLAKNESYFYAELARLKFLLDNLRVNNETFIILDEILKGTNSEDKQKGSYKVLESIIHQKGTGIIATHDLSLTKIEEQYPTQISNHCFEVEINNAEINFDYKLYDGVTQKMNALLLMQQMGIIESI